MENLREVLYCKPNSNIILHLEDSACNLEIEFQILMFGRLV